MLGQRLPRLAQHYTNIRLISGAPQKEIMRIV